MSVDGRAQVDALVDRLAPTHADIEADALVFEVEWLVAQLQAQAGTTRDTTPIEHNGATFKPRLDGSGTIISDYAATHFPLMAHTVDTHTTTHDPLEPDPALGLLTAGGTTTATPTAR